MKRIIQTILIVSLLTLSVLVAGCFDVGGNAPGSVAGSVQLPSDVPVPPGAVFDSGADTGFMILTSWHTELGRDEVKAFYDANLPSNWVDGAFGGSWVDDDEGGTGRGYSDGPRALNIVFDDENRGPNQIVIQVTGVQ